MATVAGAFFQSEVSPAAYSYMLRNIPAAERNAPLKLVDGSTSTYASTFKPTSKSDYVILGRGDKLGKLVGEAKGYDVVETGSSVNLAGTGFKGVVLTGTINATVKGGDLNENIVGNDGKNTVRASDGNDIVSGGNGNDSLFGDAGDDKLFGDAGNDKIVGGDGKDYLRGGDGHDRLFGGDGNDTLYGDEGDDTLYGDAGNDKLVGGAGEDSLFGGTGNDSLDGGADNDLVSGMTGDDKLFGGAGNDTLLGGAGDDTLWGGLGSDSLRGNEGADVFMIEKGAVGDLDTIRDFNAKEDVIDLSGTAAHKTKMKGLAFNSDSEGNTIVTVKADGTQFKLIGYDPHDIDSSFFHF